MTFEPRYTDYPDHRTPLYARGISASINDGSDGEPDVVVNEPTSGQVSEFSLDHTNKNKHVVSWESIVLTLADTIVLEFKRVSDGVWEQGATAYRIKELITSNGTNPVDAANMTAAIHSGSGSLDAVVTITGAGLAVPTMVESMEWDNGIVMHDCIMNNADLHSDVRFRIIGAATYVSGTFTLVLSE